jgi:streptogramin lyase
MNRTRSFWLLAGLLLAALPTAAHPGIGIVMDRQGNVFYTDLTHVWRITPDGAKSIAVRGVHTHELHLDAQGMLHGEHLWYADGRWGHYVWQLAPDGRLTKSPPRDGFRQNHSFVRDAAGNMYWFEPGPPAAFLRRTRDGTVTRLGENATYRDVRWISATPAGEIYFADAGDLRKLAADGSVTTLASQVRAAPGQWVGGVWLDSQNRVYVAVWGGREVKRYDPVASRVEVVARCSAPWGPSGGLVASTGDLWLLETAEDNFVRVRRISPDGRERIF